MHSCAVRITNHSNVLPGTVTEAWDFRGIGRTVMQVQIRLLMVKTFQPMSGLIYQKWVSKSSFLQLSGELPLKFDWDGPHQEKDIAGKHASATHQSIQAQAEFIYFFVAQSGVMLNLLTPTLTSYLWLCWSCTSWQDARCQGMVEKTAAVGELTVI